MKLCVDIPDGTLCSDIYFDNWCCCFDGDRSMCTAFKKDLDIDDDMHVLKCAECLKAAQ